MSAPDDIRPLGSTGLGVTALTVGTSALGKPEKVSEEEVQSTLAFALGGPWTIDTGNNYGLSEQRIGRALRVAGGLSAGRLLVTKVDPLRDNPDFSGARVRASLRESMERLGLPHLELVHLHDPERITFAEGMAPEGPVRALLDLREEGLIRHLGVAGGPIGLLQQYVATGHFEAVVTHNRYTLIDRSAGPLLDQCADAGIGVFNAAPYGGGFLSTGPDGRQRYAYRPATADQLAGRRAMADACANLGVDLATAALQFSMIDPRISSTIVGMSNRAQLEESVHRAAMGIDPDLWTRLDEIAPPARQWLGPEG